MAIKSRPGFQTNVERTAKSTERNSVFLDIKPGQTLMMRFTPTSNEDGSLFFESSQHFKFKQQGEKRAFACLNVHGDGTVACPICTALEKAVELLPKAEAEKLVSEHGASNRWHAQIIPLYSDESEKADRSYIIGLSKTTAEKVTKILKVERDTRQPLLTDPDAGQAIAIERNSATGFGTRYEVMSSGIRVSLDELLPGWEEKFLDVQKSLKLRIETPEELLGSIEETFGGALFRKLGLVG